MSWLKVSDTAAMHAIVLAALTQFDDGLDPYDRVNVLFGMVCRCAAMSAGYTTDYFVSDGTVMLVAGPQWMVRAQAAVKAGYWTRVEGGWEIIQDSTHFVHIRTADEIEWERQRKKDAATPSLVVPVRLRDGDGCRYCGAVVSWGDQRGGRGGTYDHRVPGKGAQSPEDLRVACRSCNARRGNDPDADKRVPPKPVPATPFYGAKTRALLAEHGYALPPMAAARPAALADPAPGDLTASETPPPATPPLGPRDPATVPPARPRIDDHLRSANPAKRRSTDSGSPGRVGTGRVGKPNASDPVVSPPPASRKRARRGRRT